MDKENPTNIEITMDIYTHATYEYIVTAVNSVKNELL